jgi:hypothetical protein
MISVFDMMSLEELKAYLKENEKYLTDSEKQILRVVWGEDYGKSP